MSVTWRIYKHTNKINGKCYIGLTSKDIKNRAGKNGYGYRTQYFSRAIKKYGWDNFEHEILEDNIETIEEARRKMSIAQSKPRTPKQLEALERLHAKMRERNKLKKEQKYECK